MRKLLTSTTFSIGVGALALASSLTAPTQAYACSSDFFAKALCLAGGISDARNAQANSAVRTLGMTKVDLGPMTPRTYEPGPSVEAHNNPSGLKNGVGFDFGYGLSDGSGAGVQFGTDFGGHSSVSFGITGTFSAGGGGGSGKPPEPSDMLLNLH